MPRRSEYYGPRRKLVLAFDVGTTFSGISYSFLDPGTVPQIMTVTRYPAQEQLTGAAKIPTIIYYDRGGKVCAVGAEAIRDGIYEMAEEQQWIKAEWFKLHLRARPTLTKTRLGEIPCLPLNKTVVDVLADYLNYLFTCAMNFIQQSHTNGIDMWNSVKDDIDYVLSHPNGWEGAQQSEMRRAAVLAGLIPNSADSYARLSFVTEGEASLHFAINNGLPEAAMKNGAGVVIVDAGGGTIDISSYSKNPGVSKQKFDEIAAAQCHFHGSVFVTLAARVFLAKFLEESDYVNDIDHIIRCFDKTTKHRFRSPQEPQYIKFGSTRDNDSEHNIRFGQLKLNGRSVATFFQPSIDCIVKAVAHQRKIARKPICDVVLLGGFAASDWLFDNVNSALSSRNLRVCRPTSHVHKAVSEGAISFYLDHFVQTRVSKFVYGIEASIPYDPGNSEHQKRTHDLVTRCDGQQCINNGFDIILNKNVPVLETTEFRRPYFRQSLGKEGFSFSVPILCYRGTLVGPKWKDIDPNNYSTLCTVSADLSNLPLTLISNGSINYFHLDYDIVLLFGLTEFKAQIAWKEHGIERRTEPRIVYDPGY